MKCYAEHDDRTALTFEHAKPFFVTDALADLHGPAFGIVALPVSIGWTPASTFDLSNPVRARLTSSSP